MPTLTLPTPLHRHLWPLILAIGVAIFGAFAVNTSPAVIPDLVVPSAFVAVLAFVLYGTTTDDSPATLRLSLLAVMILATFTMVYASGALAQASDPANGVVRPTESTVITIDALTLSFLVGSVMPLLTALATKLRASSEVKGIVNLLLSVLGGVLVAFQTNHGSLTYQEVAAAAIATYLSAQALYTGILRKPAESIANIAPTGGLG